MGSEPILTCENDIAGYQREAVANHRNSVIGAVHCLRQRASLPLLAIYGEGELSRPVIWEGLHINPWPHHCRVWEGLHAVGTSKGSGQSFTKSRWWVRKLSLLVCLPDLHMSQPTI